MDIAKTISPVEHDPTIITQRYKGKEHPGVDIRNAVGEVCVLPESAYFLRDSNSNGKDGYGNNYTVWQGIQSGLLFKFIHTTPVTDIMKERFHGAGTIVGITDIEGNSKGAHLHFEVWKDGYHTDPLIYFNDNKINYQNK